jgi:hypothetical protein
MWATYPRSASSGYRAEFHEGCYQKHANPLNYRTSILDISGYDAEFHVTRHNMPIHNILLTAPQLNISQKALGTLPEDGNVITKDVGATIHN